MLTSLLLTSDQILGSIWYVVLFHSANLNKSKNSFLSEQSSIRREAF